MRFEGRTALITGAASGMGLLTAQCLRAEGANVVMMDINEEILTAEAAKIGADALVTNVRKYCDIEKAAAFAVEKYGSVDITVSFAGGCPARVCKENHAFNDLSQETLDWGIDVNFRAPLYMARAVMNQMIKQERGVIINIGSISGVTGSAYDGDYSAEKAGLIGFTKAMALLGAPHHVRCCCVSPGPVLTRAAMAKMKTPLGRAAEPQEVVDLVLYLCSDQAAFITGDNYLIDGGRACGAM